MSKRSQLHIHLLPLVVLSIGVVLLTMVVNAGVTSARQQSNNSVWHALVSRTLNSQLTDQADNAGSDSGGLGQVANTGQTAVNMATTQR